MKLFLDRVFKGPDYTIGRLYINGTYFCDTLEDTVREPGVKIPGKTAIPAGAYKIVLYNSPRFKRILPLLENVPGFIGILIHNGNIPENTDGCILVGKNKQKGKVLESVNTLTALMKILSAAAGNGESLEIEIK